MDTIIELFNRDSKTFFIFMLAIIPTTIYIGWSIKNLMITFAENKKGGEYK